MSKSPFTLDKLDRDIDTSRNWVDLQMSLEMNWSKIEIDRVETISLFDISKNEELKEWFNWINTEPLLKQVHRRKRTQFLFFTYRLEILKAFQFLKLNDEEE